MNSKPRILVTTANGNIGKAVTHQLLQKGYPVTAFVRRKDSRSEALAAAGASIFVGDNIEADDLRQAMRGVQRAYFAAPWTPTQLHGAMNFDQLYAMRPVMGWADHRTPIKGLYLCGAASHPGGGVMGACGKNAAEEILRDN